jgi:hypothetical protein
MTNDQIPMTKDSVSRLLVIGAWPLLSLCLSAFVVQKIRQIEIRFYSDAIIVDGSMLVHKGFSRRIAILCCDAVRRDRLVL